MSIKCSGVEYPNRSVPCNIKEIWKKKNKAVARGLLELPVVYKKTRQVCDTYSPSLSHRGHKVKMRSRGEGQQLTESACPQEYTN